MKHVTSKNKVIRRLNVQVPFECLSAQVFKRLECPSAQVPFNAPSTSSARVPKCISALSAQVFKCSWIFQVLFKSPSA